MSVEMPRGNVVAPLLAVEDNTIFSFDFKDCFICAVCAIKSVLDSGDDGASAGVREDNIPFNESIVISVVHFEFSVHFFPFADGCLFLHPLYIYYTLIFWFCQDFVDMEIKDF